jgi:hypothetical protein
LPDNGALLIHYKFSAGNLPLVKVLTQGRYFLLKLKEERRVATRKNKNP